MELEPIQLGIHHNHLMIRQTTLVSSRTQPRLRFDLSDGNSRMLHRSDVHRVSPSLSNHWSHRTARTSQFDSLDRERNIHPPGPPCVSRLAKRVLSLTFTLATGDGCTDNHAIAHLNILYTFSNTFHDSHTYRE